MGKMAANGPFTPVVIAMRAVVGEKKFNQIRGKGITLHSQVGACEDGRELGVSEEPEETEKRDETQEAALQR
jgi:hypothetical protein